MPLLELTPDRLSGLSGDIDTAGFKAARHPFPDFLIVGPQRTGSSWLRTNLCKHPQVFMPFKKEVFFFSHLQRKDHKRYRSNRLEDYCGLFRIRGSKKIERAVKALRYGMFLPKTIFGEATASYATMPDSFIRNIFTIHPDIKIIIIVRNPVTRSWSHAKKTLVRDQNRKLDEVPFEEFENYYRSASNLKRGSYSDIIQTWRSFTKPENLLVAEYRKLAQDPAAFLKDVQEFLAIATGPEFARKHLNTIVNPTSRDPLPDSHRQLLSQLFNDEISRLENDFNLRF